MPSPNQQGVEFGARISPDDYAEFQRLFPVYGAATWFINSALQAFLKELRADANLQAVVTRSIQSMLEERRRLANDTFTIDRQGD